MYVYVYVSRVVEMVSQEKYKTFVYQNGNRKGNRVHKYNFGDEKYN